VNDAAPADIHPLETENRQLRQTIDALRQRLEEAQAQQDARIQQALAASQSELLQLRQTIVALRAEMERLQGLTEKRIEEVAAAARDENRQLRDTIVALRTRMDAAVRRRRAREDDAKLRERLRRVEMLLDLTRRAASVESLDPMLELIVTTASREIGADRGTLFLNDPATGELYSRVAQGNISREIRLLNDRGIAGHVFQSGEALIIRDAYADPRFDRSIDEQTGYRTKNILCVPVRTVKGDLIGVAQMLNKLPRGFTRGDQELLEAMTTQAALVLQHAMFIESVQKAREQEMAFLDMVADVTSEIDLPALLKRIMGEATRMLSAERSTLFLIDEKTDELFSIVGEGVGAFQIRLPSHAGIAGAVYTSGQSVNIPHAYADLRFNPSFDRQTGFFTRSILCVPVVNKQGRIIGVTQCLNRRGGPFTVEDEQRLKAFTAQVAVALENAKLFNDVQNMKNYNEGVLQSMTNGVVTLDEDGKITTCNAEALKIFELAQGEIVGRRADEFFAGPNDWILEKIEKVKMSGASEVTMDADLQATSSRRSVNATVVPLISTEAKSLGTMVMLDDISSEKRMKSTMARYMDPGIADQLLAGGNDLLGGKSVEATVLFTDIRGFTTLSEELGAQGIVTLLNEYFEIMVDCITREGGMLDKFIGDAIMAAFGIPLAHDDDADRAVRAAISMIRDLRRWNAERVAEGKRPLDMGIGLNTDLVVSGNIGSAKRMDFTIIGDGVNLAARLESACKQYHARILVSENTVARLKGTYRLRGVDLLIVKGKTKPVEVFEVLDYHDEASFPNAMAVLGAFKFGVDAYRAGRWDDALDAFGRVQALNPDDGLAGMYVDRCRKLRAEPPAAWDGVWVAREK
jgi:adenylate cyclase